MATFDPISYTYIPTTPHFKSTKAPYNCTLKQVSILDKIKCIKASETSTIYSSNDKEEEEEEDNNDNLPTIEDLLYTTLKKEGFATEDSSPDHRVRGIGEVDVEKRGRFTNHNRSVLGRDSGSSSDDLIVLLEDDNLGASEAEVDHGSLYAENAGPNAGNQLGQEDRLHAGRSTADERKYKDELIHPALNTDTFDKGERQQQEAEVEGGVDKDDDEDNSQLQVGDTHLSSKGDKSTKPAKRQRLLPYSDSSLEPSHDEARSYSDSYSDDELNNTKAKLDMDDKRLRPAKRKRLSLSYDSPTQWRHKNYLQYISSHQHKPCSKSQHHYPKSYSLLDQGSRVAAGSSAKGQLPSPAPSVPQATDTDMSPDYCNPSPRNVLLILTEVTFHPYSLYCYSFTTLAQLIESIGHVGKIDDFTIKLIEHHSFLLTGFSWYTLSQPSFSRATLLTTTEAGRNHIDATHTRPQNGRAIDARALASRRNEPPSSDNDGSLSDSDPESSSGDNGYLNLDEQRQLVDKADGFVTITMRKAQPRGIVIIKCFTDPESANKMQMLFESHFHVIFEHVPTTLAQIAVSPVYLTECKLATIIGQILHSLEYLASNRFKHSSLKCCTVLINAKGQIKITDQECCKSSSRTSSRDVKALGYITIALMQKYYKDDGLIGVENLDRWPSDSNAIDFLSMITSTTSIKELLKEEEDLG
ncbi:MAG: hypothetical protein M1840_008865 [Geoglossum simile]|nr:MAG: hypothetical protein M1840_008865 [Geoglossum simile]